MKRYILQDIGPEVQRVVDKVQALVDEGGEEATLLTPAERALLESWTGLKYNTTAYWDEHPFYIPGQGEFVIYCDYIKFDDDGVTKYVPGIKIGSGNAYLADLAFINNDAETHLQEHINDHIMHTTAEEKAFWNNKINIPEAQEVVNETLVFNRQ